MLSYSCYVPHRIRRVIVTKDIWLARGLGECWWGHLLQCGYSGVVSNIVFVKTVFFLSISILSDDYMFLINIIKIILICFTFPHAFGNRFSISWTGLVALYICVGVCR